MTDPRTGSAWILGDKFELVYPHLGSISNLWFKKWKFPCERSLYPFHDGKYEDFAPVFESLVDKAIHDGYTDDYTREFIPTAEALVKVADQKLESGAKDEAIGIYLRACAVYRIARFPYINSDLKRDVYSAQKKAYMKAAALFDVPIEDVEIPHTAGTAEDEGDTLPLYVRVPKGACKDDPVPAVILMCGLDGHRPDNTTRSDEFLKRRWASVIVGEYLCSTPLYIYTYTSCILTSPFFQTSPGQPTALRSAPTPPAPSASGRRSSTGCKHKVTSTCPKSSSGAFQRAATTPFAPPTPTRIAFSDPSAREPARTTSSVVRGSRRLRIMNIRGLHSRRCRPNSDTRARKTC
jgi:hypothetical protein